MAYVCQLQGQRLQREALKDDSWMVAYAYIEFDFAITMNKLKMKLKFIYDYVVGIKKETWERQTFNSRCKVILVVNDLYESFNYYILEARDKPILILME